MNKGVIIGIVVFTLLVLVGGTVLLSSSGSVASVSTSQNAKASVDSFNFDWGNIPMNGGNVEKTFTIKNTGSDTLKLYNVKTSCHCTKAQVEVNGKKSPLFGMSSISSWIGEVGPNQEAKLTVIFDPAYHGPQGAGSVSRLVSLQTNDLSNPKLEFSLTAVVVK